MALLNVLKSITKRPDTLPVVVKKPLLESPKKILVVEDEADLRELYVEVLMQEGFDVISAEDGNTGLESVVNNHPNLVLLDLMMPVMDGKTMLRKMREIPEYKNTPVIILTNAGDIDSMRETKLYQNASLFLIKANVTPQDIVNSVKTFS